MKKSFDVIVVGLGAMGSATAYYLAQNGCSILGIDRFTPPHDMGSSHGDSRVIREAYFESPIYVPLVQKAYENWRQLEHLSGQSLLQKTGGVMIGPPEGILVKGAKSSAEIHGLAHEVLSAAQIRERFPCFRPDDSMIGIFEPNAGVLFPERCIAAYLELAEKQGATLLYEEPVFSWDVKANKAIVATRKGEYQADKLLLTAGAWMANLVIELAPLLSVERQMMCWFAPQRNNELFAPDKCPVHIWEYADEKFFYSIPDFSEGVKFAMHHDGNTTQINSIDRQIREHEVAALREQMRRYVPDSEGELVKAKVCMYTNTNDGHFLIDFHPQYSQVLLASICSGHGFKFSSAMGELLAQIMLEQRETIPEKVLDYEINLFRMSRFSKD